jgi:putative FmdB family regulatory protein
VGSKVDRGFGIVPTYDYQCRSCGHRFEVFERMMNGRGRACPRCSGRAKRQISGGGGVLFKGSGFYSTDSKENKPEPAKEE